MVLIWKSLAHNVVEETIQPPAGHLLRALQLDCACRSITRIGKEIFANLLPLGVEPLERSVGHNHLSPHLKVVGPPFALQHQGHAADGADIGRNIIATGSIATCNSTQQTAVLIGKRDGRTVKLQLAHKLGLALLSLHSFHKLTEFFKRVGIAERQHREAVRNRHKTTRKVATNPHRWGVRVVTFGVCGLQLLQLTQQAVIFVVAHHGSGFNIVFVIV